MADDVDLANPTGTAAADDVGGKLYQRIKLAFGADGSAADANATNPFPVKTDQGYTSPSGTITRPSNTTAYAAGDVVGATAAAITFANIGPSGKDIIITGVELRFDITAVPSGMTSFRLHLYSVTPPSAAADNAAFDLVSGDRASYLGFIDLGSPEDLGSTVFGQVNGVNKPVKLAGTDLFAYLVTAAAWTPASAATHAINLHSAA